MRKPTAKKAAKRKSKAKAKLKPRKRVLTEAQKQKAEARKQMLKVRELKKTALSPPKKLPDNAWTAFASEATKAPNRAALDKSLGERFKNFTPAELEVGFYQIAAEQSMLLTCVALQPYSQ